MATLVNGNGNPAVYAQQDADLYVGVMGTTSCIMSVGSKFAATIETANLISVADGVILTKEGRRIQTDVGEVDEFNIPNGAAGVTRYYIIGYHLYTDGQGSQKCETFVQLMSSATDTIPEAEFRNGATEVYVSLYRVTQVGLTLNNPESLLPDALNLGDINASLTENLNDISLRYNTTSSRPEWKERGADTWNPFNTGVNFVAFSGTNGNSSRIYSNSDGTYSMNNTSYGNDEYLVRLRDSDLISSSRFQNPSIPQSGVYITLAKTGYYLTLWGGGGSVSTPTSYTAGQEISSSNYNSINVLIYLGETNPYA